MESPANELLRSAVSTSELAFGPLDDELVAMIRREEWTFDLWWLFTRWVKRTRALGALLARVVETATLNTSQPAAW